MRFAVFARSAGLVALVIGVTILPPGPMHGMASQFPIDAAGEVLAQRTSAFNEDRRADFLSTSPGQENYYDALKKIGAANFDSFLYPDEPDLTRGSDTMKHGAETIVTVATDAFEIPGVSSGRKFLRDNYWTFARTSQGWRIVSDSALEDLGLLSARDLWDFGSIEVQSSENFVLVYHPGQLRDANTLLSEAEAAIPPANRVWRVGDGKQMIFAPAQATELKRILEVTFDVSNFVAFAATSVDRRDDDAWEIGASRILINPASFLSRSSDSRRKILSHELVHVATREATGPYVPSFLEEGIAELTRPGPRGLLAKSARDGSFDNMLPRDWEFVSGTGTDILIAYQESASAVEFLRAAHGAESIDRLYRALGALRVIPGTPRYLLDKAFRESLDISLKDFEGRWAAQVRQ